MKFAVAVPSTLPNGHPSANISPAASQGEADGVSEREYDVAGIGGGEFALRLVPRQRAAPLYWRLRSHTHTCAWDKTMTSLILDHGATAYLYLGINTREKVMILFIVSLGIVTGLIMIK